MRESGEDGEGWPSNIAAEGKRRERRAAGFESERRRRRAGEGIGRSRVKMFCGAGEDSDGDERMCRDG